MKFCQLLTCLCVCSCTGIALAQERAPQHSEPPATPLVQPGVYFWEQMDVEHRAQLWPLLTHEQRLMHWRYMSKDERAQLRRFMTHKERQDIKRRYVSELRPLTQEELDQCERRMTSEERRLMRQQIVQVHVEIRRGVPYNCTDPTDCPKSAYRSRIAEASAQDNGKPPHAHRAGSLVVDSRAMAVHHNPPAPER